MGLDNARVVAARGRLERRWRWRRRRIRRRLDRAVRVSRPDRPLVHARTARSPNFDGTGFNDRASSAVVNSGTWQLCADAELRQQLRGIPARAARQPRRGDGPGQLGAPDVARRRRAAEAAVRGGAVATGADRRASCSTKGQNFQGRAFTVNSDVLANLDGTGFNDRAVVDARRARLLDVLHRRQFHRRMPDVRARRLCDRCRGSPTASRPGGASRTTIPYNAPPRWWR